MFKKCDIGGKEGLREYQGGERGLMKREEKRYRETEDVGGNRR